MPEVIVVLGGNGFVGSAVCRAAIERGYGVKSIARRGPPPTLDPTTDSNPTTTNNGDHDRRNRDSGKEESLWWWKKVAWLKGDALDPSTYREHLVGAKAVVCTIGTLFEGKTPETSYASVNRDTAVRASNEAVAAGVKCFVYLSASRGLPMFPGYFAAKREAEDHLLSLSHSLRPILFRPEILYSWEQRPLFSAVVGLPLHLLRLASSPIRSLLPKPLRVEAPLPVEALAKAVIAAIENDDVRGVQSVADIQRLASQV